MADPQNDVWISNRSIAAVLFDFDGTLVDTMPLHYEAYRRVLAEERIELNENHFYACVGGNARETIPKFLAGRPCRLTPAEIHARKKALVQEIFCTQPVQVLETARFITALHGQVRLAVASSGSRAGIEVLLNRLGWVDYFQAVVAGEDAPRGKPAPDLFLLAAEKLGVCPGECLVFEDTDAGIQAGESAGMRVFDVRVAGRNVRGVAAG